MKRSIKYLIYIVILVLLTTNNVFAKKCEYYTSNSNNYLSFELGSNVTNMSLEKNLNDMSKYEGIYGASIKKNNWNKIPSDCPKYLAVAVNYQEEYHVLLLDNVSSMSELEKAVQEAKDQGVEGSTQYKTDAGSTLIMALNGNFPSDYNEEDIIPEKKCDLEYQKVNNSSNTNFSLKDMNYNLLFSFTKSSSGKKEYCVTINKTETACAESSEVLKMKFSGKTYKFQIEQTSKVLNAYYPTDKCLNNKNYCIREKSGVYTFTTATNGACNVIDITASEEDKVCKYKNNVYYGPDGTKVSKSEFEKLCNVDCDVFSGEFGKVLKIALSFIRFLVPIIIIGLTIVDFIKATTAHDESLIKKAANNAVKRFIIGVIIFVLPTILEFILDLADIEYGTCGIK